MKPIIIFILALLSIYTNAQRTISLEEAYKLRDSDNGIPDDISYVKDTKKELDKFVGVWKGKFEGKTYEFRFEKKENFGDFDIKWDKIIGRAIIKDKNGKIIYNDLNKTDDKVSIFGIDMQNKVYVLNFTANYRCLDSGVIYIEIKKDNPNQMRLDFSRDTGIYNAAKCPNFETYETTLPNRKVIILNKQ